MLRELVKKKKNGEDLFRVFIYCRIIFYIYDVINAFSVFLVIARLRVVILS